QRARALRATCERLGASIVTVRVADATDPIPSAPFDGVLVDPPCSGLGTLQSHPDLRWHASPEAIERLVPLQQRILDNARASASRLVYSVCTLSPAEELVPGGTRTFPPTDHTDGFYIASDGAA
ncbi:MAG TPA: hypothetical protein VNT22_08880, partial [Baekduia sp.]|nr:hypothetical protein [Baekduia sp.]